ncbi:uncharacterized protein LOC122040004 [Zingiber officinale]|uniref:uncharacterized protein LOC122040004 n=1 Tax=Zingiber officinale TaxID=94328 RepID=UPI001C4B145D|nr:uncharacterized protein LOC122040004 [Zingiber officinale]
MVASTYFQKIKFQMDDKVGKVKGDQLATRQCYVEMVKSEARATRKNPLLEVNTITDKPSTLVYEEKEERLREWCEGYDIQHAFTFVAYPQSNGQAKVTNWENLRGLWARLDHAEGSWVDELPSVLRALSTTPKEATGVTPFHLVYGDEAMVPVEVGVKTDQVQLYDKGNAERRLMELDLVDEAWDKAIVRLIAYR